MGSDDKICGSCKRIYRNDKDVLTVAHQWRVCSAENLWFNCPCGSTLMIPKGKYPWYAPTLGMSPQAATLFNRIGALKDLPHIPAAVMQLQQLLVNPEVETSALVHAVKGDPFIATEIMAVADNMRRVRKSTASTKEAQNLEYAITFIGRKHLSNLVATAALKKFQLATVSFNQDEFWQHAFLVAGIAETLTGEFFPNLVGDKDRAYLAGCLCNIGKIVAALAYPKESDRVYQQVYNPKSQTTWVLAEDQNALPSHCTLGEIGGAFWGFPDFVLETIKFHHSPPTTDHEGAREPWLCHLVCLANMLGHWLNLEPHRIDHNRLELEAAYFNLKRGELEALVTRLVKILQPLSL